MESSQTTDASRPVSNCLAHVHLTGLACAGIALATYLLTLAPTVTAEDSGELIAAAQSLGIPHPPGYPLWCLLAHAFIHLIPVGGIAWRVNLFSAVAAAATVYAVFVLIARQTRDHRAAVAGALALAFSFEFWEQSVIAEVYTLNTLLLAILLLLFFQYQSHRRPRDAYAFALVYGISLANHYGMILLAPFFLAGFILTDWPLRHLRRRYMLMLFLMLPGLALYLYLPLRSMARPPIDWGHPSTWPAFWDVVTRKQFAFLLQQTPRSLDRFFRQLAGVGQLYPRQFTPALAWIPIVGWLAWVRRNAAAAAVGAAVAAATVLGATLVANYPPNPEGTWIMSVFLIPAWLIAAIGIGWAVHAARRMPWGGPAAYLAGCACALLPLAANWHANDRSAFYYADDYGRNVLATLAPDALYFPTADFENFPVQYLQIVEGSRPDVRNAAPYGYIDPESYADMPPSDRPASAPYLNASDRARVLSWILAHTNRPAYFTAQQTIPGWQLVPDGLLLRAVPDTAPTPRPPAWPAYRWRNPDVTDAHGDYYGILTRYGYHLARTRWWFAQDEFGAGLTEAAKAATLAENNAGALNNLGVACARYGLYEPALQYFDQALKADPGYRVARQNRGKVVQRLNLAAPAKSLLH